MSLRIDEYFWQNVKMLLATKNVIIYNVFDKFHVLWQFTMYVTIYILCGDFIVCSNI